ncbi:MAG: drug/metabolite transporter (DMT)-like permease [Porticoccus sp.]|jgi:drug/metabolite transporter (DMT)-like permease
MGVIQSISRLSLRYRLVCTKIIAKFVLGYPVPQQQNISLAISLSFAMVVIGSISTAAVKYMADIVEPTVIVAVQYTVGLLLCLPAVVKKGSASLKTDKLALHLLRGIAGVLGFYLYYASLKHIPLVDGMLLRQAAPLCVPLVMLIWLRQTISGITWIPLVIGFIGIALLLQPGSDSGTTWHGVAFLSAICLSFSMVSTGELAETEPNHRILFYYFAMSTVAILPFAIGSMGGITARVWLILIVISIAMYSAIGLYTKAYSLAKASTIAPINYFSVLVSGLIGWLVWDEIPNLIAVLGMVLIIAGGIATIVWKDKFN